ncbi:hypothetical protein [Planctomycetes bacterium TBK1r]|uniref:hypothetical protein n=1 Tax=Stieleria magnilauensis TaxID=2527963 RepID=UPI0011A2A66B
MKMRSTIVFINGRLPTVDPSGYAMSLSPVRVHPAGASRFRHRPSGSFGCHCLLAHLLHLLPRTLGSKSSVHQPHLKQSAASQHQAQGDADDRAFAVGLTANPCDNKKRERDQHEPERRQVSNEHRKETE